MNRSSLFLLISTVALCAACSSAQQENLGPITATGSVMPASISLVRRGTHLFQISKQEQYFLESKEINLSELEGKEVFLEGIRVANTKKNEHPVIIIKSIHEINEETHAWEIPSLGIQLKLPSTWQGTLEKEKAVFTMSGSTILTAEIRNEKTPFLGKEIFVDGRKAVINTSAKEQPIVMIDGEKKIMIQFAKESICGLVAECGSPEWNEEEWVQSFTQKTISFLQENNKSEESPMTGKPCGGEAGILCPSGSFCDIQDAKHQVGICRARK